ncbi:C39 family peptidase [Legionella sp. W05-934-2]|jgi:hypothetical protein|uniref:C39 family peptidase n=1 Tax=Legionella sp. W05-934-2 TaxID=1198649 RepID=UPI0034632B49
MKLSTFLLGCSLFALSFFASAENPSPSAPESLKNAVRQYYGFSPNDQFILLNVKGYQQTEDYTCGPSTAMQLMRFYGMLSDSQMTRKTELTIAKEMGSNSNSGTSPKQIVTWLKSHGFNVTYGENGNPKMLHDNLKKGIPVIVEWIDWGGHWEVVSGINMPGGKFDPAFDSLILADPAAHFLNPAKPFIEGLTMTNVDRFDSMWFDAQYFKPGHLVKGIYIIATPK